MQPIGLPELIIILVIVIVVFGLGRLPTIGRSLGQMIRAFRKNVGEEETRPGLDLADQPAVSGETRPDSSASPAQTRRTKLEQALDQVAAAQAEFSLALALKVILEIYNMTQYRLEQEAGVDRATISRILNGRTKSPQKDTIIKLLAVFTALPSRWREDLLTMAGHPSAEADLTISQPLQVYVSCYSEELVEERAALLTLIGRAEWLLFNLVPGDETFSMAQVETNIRYSDYLVMIQGWRWVPLRLTEYEAAQSQASVRAFYFQKDIGLSLQPEAQQFVEKVGQKQWKRFADTHLFVRQLLVSLCEAHIEESRLGRRQVSLHSLIALFLIAEVFNVEEFSLGLWLQKLFANREDNEAAPQVASPEPENPVKDTTRIETSDEPDRVERRQGPRHAFEPEMVPIPAGEFWMGSDRRQLERAGVEWSDWRESELPAHKLSLFAYAIGRYPVTNAEYAHFVEAGGYRLPEYWTQTGWQWRRDQDRRQPVWWNDSKWNGASYPVVGVSWYEAVAYCRWLSKVTGRPFQLPTEAEWEKAARGPAGNIWPWGNVWDPNRCNSFQGGSGQTTAVGQYSPAGDSYYGVVDMVGNVWEWCVTKYEDGFKPYPYDLSESEWRAAYLEKAVYRALRGGSWSSDLDYARCVARYLSYPYLSNGSVGFRVVAPISES